MVPPSPSDDFIAQLLAGRRVLVAGHLHPDGDAVGSAVAMALALRAMGRDAFVTTSGLVAGNLDFLLKPADLVVEADLNGGLAGRFDLLVLVDCQSLCRVWPGQTTPEAWPPVPMVAVDHHQAFLDPVRYDAAFIDPGAAAATELVFKVLKRLGVEFSPPIVEALLAGLVSDTGSFSQGNATSECLRQASELVAMGGDIERVNRRIRQNWPLSRVRLMAMSLSTLAVHFGGRVATMIVTEDMLREAGSDLSETEGLVEHTLLVRGVELGALVKINARGGTRVSMRSRPGVDVRELARRLGGGGHQQAAAYVCGEEDPRAARDLFLAEAAALLKGLR